MAWLPRVETLLVRRRRCLIAAGLLLAVLTGLRLWPHPSLRAAVPGSTALYASDGELLRLALASDQQYRLWVPLAEIEPRLVEAVLLYEDRWFYWHAGVNPLALARASLATYGHGARQGASTITMQLARRLYRIRSQTVGGKLRQLLAALWLEARYSKREILEAYLNLAPYGGNIEGVGAASLIYFHKRASQLTLPEVLTLAVIPQNPRKRGGMSPPRNQPAALATARERLWLRWLKQHREAAKYQAEIQAPIKLKATASLPFRAPHMTDVLLRMNKDGELWSTLDLRKQTTLERILTQFVDNQRGQGVSNASAILLDRESGEVRALVGSADYFDGAIDGQVNGAQARRSPGSTLKPFIYGLALDQGLLHPLTVLKDAPTAFGPFSPENFDGRFVGPITAQDALVRSRNVPAVAIASRLKQPNLYAFLKSAGISGMASEKHYGLALALGGGEVTMEELARLYLMLGNRGEMLPLRYERLPLGVKPAAETKRMLSEEAAFITLQMLKTNARPDTGASAVPPVAWKTGTSWGFRDAWTAGVLGQHVLIVWVGNFDGSSNAAFIGIRTAAPLFFKIVDSLRAQKLDGHEAERLLPPNVTRVEVCTASGDLPNEACRDRSSTWFIPGKSPIRISRLHREVKIDSRTGSPTCESGPHVRIEIHEFWPSDMQGLFREAGMPRRQPPAMPDCLQADRTQEDAPVITSPNRGATYTMQLSKMTPIALRASAAASGQTLYWFANGGLVGKSRASEGLGWLPNAPGRYQLRVIDQQGRADVREVAVEFIP
ncbi:penicillin-binding protein 1C [Noviherbaspirillum sedimenti]|uniref:peptidoglycan glycosyltransferase n=2 Tax=Noviherbaspirillum sedimenti TaxID=2320865 RepID=A0A3A3G751_9BURK|nr:penicillin-binding protein 1C [Noviherbaspirillum sedimenti]